jgi:hypothetical protein
MVQDAWNKPKATCLDPTELHLCNQLAQTRLIIMDDGLAVVRGPPTFRSQMLQAWILHSLVSTRHPVACWWACAGCTGLCARHPLAPGWTAAPTPSQWQPCSNTITILKASIVPEWHPWLVAAIQVAWVAEPDTGSLCRCRWRAPCRCVWRHPLEAHVRCRCRRPEIWQGWQHASLAVGDLSQVQASDSFAEPRNPRAFKNVALGASPKHCSGSVPAEAAIQNVAKEVHAAAAEEQKSKTESQRVVP